MSTATEPSRSPESSTPAATGFRRVGRPVEGEAAILVPELQALLTDLHRRFEPARRQRLAARVARQAEFDAGMLPDFRADTRAIREGDWTVAPIPAALQDRRVEITGPVDPKMVINALNAGANCFMADFEDSNAPSFANQINGQRALREAVDGTLSFTATETGKRYALDPASRTVLIVRPRGWHLDEAHVTVDGGAIGGGLFDLACFAFHNGKTLAERERGPYVYLPKLECMEEAQLWDEVLAFLEVRLGLAVGTIKATVLIETLPAVFEMHEILHALRGRIVGLNCGRWDYIFSYLKTLRRHRDRVLPERGQVTMTQPFLKAYSELLIQTCHRRGAHAMGGMAAQIPIKGDAEANERAMQRVRADKLREVMAGHDGTWVAHPALIPIAREIFDTHMPSPNQQHIKREDVRVTREDLLKPSLGTITRAGFDNNVEVCVRYMAAWLAGHGCVPIHHLMEDAATAEISRTQLWRWLHHPQIAAKNGTLAGPLHLDDGTPVDWALFERALINLPAVIGDRTTMPGGERLDAAIALLDRLTHADTLEAFLTSAAYPQLVDL